MPYLKQYIRLVTYQKSEKSMAWLPRNAQKCIFFTPFSPFLAKNFFFQKSGFVSFLEPQKATLMPKIRKNYGVVRVESIRTDVRTDVREQNYRTSQILGSVQQAHTRMSAGSTVTQNQIRQSLTSVKYFIYIVYLLFNSQSIDVNINKI